MDGNDSVIVDDKKVSLKEKMKTFFSKKRNVVIFVLAIAVIIAAAVLAILLLTKDNKTNGVKQVNNNEETEEVKVVKYYDNLTGEVISYSGDQYDENGKLKTKEDGSTLFYTEKQAEQQADQNNTKRINCIQIPNGTDARPQVGLNEAKIVYEAIAEGGITRFAAIFRGTNARMIGPVRSLRTYFLEWDTPYDCTIVHAGGEKKALEQVKSRNHLSESTTYMWRDYSEYYNPNNLFTSAELLNSFNRDQNYQRSEPKVFPRLTSEQNDKELKKIKKAEKAASNEYAFAKNIYIHVTAAQNYNVKYDYDATTNTYLRSYEGNSGKHMVYDCSKGYNTGNKMRPKRECELKQVAPKVVAVIKVDEKLNQDNHYREDISTTGSGDAWIFQNGVVIEADWNRGTNDSGLKFKDKKTGNEIKLAPGQTFITAIAKSYGYVKY